MADTRESDCGSEETSDTQSAPLATLVKVALLAAVIYFFVWPLIQEFPKAWDSIRNLDPWLGLLAVGIDVVSWLAYAYLLQQLISRQHRPSLFVTFGTVVASRGLSRVVPVGAAGTVAVQYKLMHDAEVPNDEVAYAVSAQAVISVLVLNVMMVSGLLVALSTISLSFELITAGVFALFVVIGIAIVVLVLVRYTDKTAHVVAKLLAYLPRVDGSKGAELVASVADRVKDLITDPNRLARLFLSSVINWLLGAVSVWVTLLALGQSSRFLGVLVAFSLANVVAALPISPGGIGIYEAAMTATLGLFGVPRAMAVAGTVTFRLIDFWFPIPLGALWYLWLERVLPKAGRAKRATR